MRLTSLTSITLCLILLGMPFAANAQRAINLPATGYAAIILDAAYEGEEYSVSIVQLLKDKYQWKLKGASQMPVFEWVAVDPMPPGLTIDSATGQVFGTLIKSRPQPYLIRIHVFDKAVSNPSPLKLQLSLKVTRGARPGKAPTLESINSPADRGMYTNEEGESGNGATSNGDKHSHHTTTVSSRDVDVHAVEPKESTTLTMTLKNPSIRQLEVVVKNKDGKLIDMARTPEDLPRDETRTFVNVKLEEGDNQLEVRNADTGEVYSTLPVMLKQQKASPPKSDKPPVPEVIHSGSVPKEAQDTQIRIKVEDQSINWVKIKLQSKKGAAEAVDLPKEQQPQLMRMNRGQDDYEKTIPLASDPDSITLVTVVATDDKGKEISPEKKSKEVEIKRTGPAGPPPIKVSYSGLVNKEATSVPLQIVVNDPKISKLKVLVTPAPPKPADPTATPQADPSKVIYGDVFQLSRGEDSVLKVVGLPSDDKISVWVYNVSKLTDEEAKDALDKENGVPPVKYQLERLNIERRSDGSPVSTIVTNSLNTRAIIGFEQSGASSADSQSKPFLDFFFTAPLRFKPKGDTLPRVAAWGQVRLAAIPQQVSTFGTLPANFVSPLAEGKLTELVQGFDFMAGLEVRVFGTNKPYVSLIPGVKNQTFMSLVAGGGAISPLSARDNRSAAQIFAVPGVENPQRALFVARYGENAASKKYIGFVFPDRDRFLRQFYAGARFKTFYYEDNGTLINRFPAILDIMIGQNEAVTGGRLQSDVTDEKGRIIDRKRRYVLRLEAFYPFPIKEASFLYLYGTAMMKIGGGGVKIETPLFLNTAPGEVSLTSNDLFIAPTLQTNRDYYRFGVGVNLTELFNRKPPTNQR